MHVYPQRIAIIDLGTNSVRFDVHEVLSPTETRLLHREKLMVRLGENLFLTGRLDRRAIRRTFQAFAVFRHASDLLQVDRIVAFGTSALREAKDGRMLVEMVRRKLEIDLKVISGREEARLIASGILPHLTRKKNRFGLLDIGGGSTELSLCQNGKVIRCESLPLGVARLQQIFLRDNPPEGGIDAVDRLRSHIREVLERALKKMDWPQVDLLVGSSGTIRALARLSKKISGTRSITRESIKKSVKLMIPLDLEELRELPGMDPKRLDLVLAGGVLLEEVMTGLSVPTVVASDYSLRDGMLQDILDRLKNPEPANDVFERSVLRRAQDLGTDLDQLQRRLELAKALFTKLRGIHKLGEDYLDPFICALLLKDVGRSISTLEPEKHASYVVRHLDLGFDTKWKVDLTAAICAHLTAEDLDESPENLPAPARSAFAKLLGMGRMLEVLDSTYPNPVSIKKIELRNGILSVLLTPNSAWELAALNLSQRRSVIEPLLGLRIEVLN